MVTLHEDLIDQAHTARRGGKSLNSLIADLDGSQLAAVQHIDPEQLSDLIEHLEHRMFCGDCANIHAGPCYPDEPLGLDEIVPQ